MIWKDFIESSESQFPFIKNIIFSGNRSDEFCKVPDIIKIPALALLGVVDSGEPAKLAFIFPKTETIPIWLSFLAAFYCIKEQAKDYKLPKLIPGQKVLLDGKDYVYKREEFIENEAFYVLEMAGGAFQKIPQSKRLRIQHSISERKLTKTDQLPLDGITDDLLGTNLRGNTSMLSTSVLLVAGTVDTKQTISGICANSDEKMKTESKGEKLMDVFGWGNIYNGETKLWGSSGKKEKPCVLVCSDFIETEEFMEDNPERVKVVIVDGSSYLRDSAAFQQLIAEYKIPIVFILSGKDSDAIGRLEKKDFKFWSWNKEELSSLTENFNNNSLNPFNDLVKKTRSFANFKIDSISCSAPALPKAFQLLEEVKRALSKEDFRTHVYTDKLYSQLIYLTRSFALPEYLINKARETLSNLKKCITENIFINKRHAEDLSTTVNFLEKSLTEFDHEDSKFNRLRNLIKDLCKSRERVCIVLANRDFEAIAAYLKRKLPFPDKLDFAKVSNFRSKDFDHMIVCGYLRRGQMHKILDAAPHSGLSIFGYEHETEWIASVKRNYDDMFGGNKRTYKKFASMAPTERKEPVKVEKEVPERRSRLEDFEFKINAYRRERILAKLDGEGDDNVSARCLTFVRGNIAFVTESYNIPVVTDVIEDSRKREDIPQRKIDSIQVGDYLLFRESSDRDLIRETADIGLKNAGKEGLREKSAKWRVALQTVYTECGKDPRKVWEKLREYNCRRTKSTIRTWLSDENPIAPQDKADIEKIMYAAGDDELEAVLDETLEAIESVRSAHRQAAHQIIKKLNKAVAENIDDIEESDFAIEFEGVGTVTLVCVESIDSECSQVPSHKANILLTERNL